MSQSTYSRRRESIVDIEEQINDIFTKHTEVRFNNADIPVIPAHSLPDVFTELSLRYGVAVLTKEEETQVESFVQANPGIEVTPELLLGFVAQATAKHAELRSSPESSPDLSEEDRGREEDRDFEDHGRSRSSSKDSRSTSTWRNEPRSAGSYPPDSPFEAKARQRSGPLAAGPPSSWARRPAPANRRKSDADSRRGSFSDSETPSQHSRAGPRTRAPSTPSSPITYSPESTSPPLPGRPHSRAQSHSNFSLDYGVQRFGSHSPQRKENGMVSPPPERSNSYSPRPYSPNTFSPKNTSLEDNTVEHISSLPIPGRHDSDSDGEEEDATHRVSGLIMDHERSVASSTVSLLGSHDQLEALQKNNQELARRLVEAERSLQNRLADHEAEIEEMQAKVDELRSELMATKREEKELRNKERQNMQQIQVLESELAKLQKALDSSRALYQSLHKQYVEQCGESEKLRTSLRQKDYDIKALEEVSQMHQLEFQKLNQQRETLEATHALTEQELAVARQAQNELEDQKQENLVLKETIDRLRFDLDDLRTREHAGSGGPSAATSQFGSVSKSLGVELMSRWDEMGEDEDVPEDETAVDEEEEASDTDGEEMIQTIITRKKRKITSGNKRQVVEVTETKQYSDAYTQHCMSDFVSSAATQTDPEPRPPTTVASTQTEPEPRPSMNSSAIQTDPEPKPRMASKEIQTEPEPAPIPSTRSEPVATPMHDSDDELASSSSTVRPPTPKASPRDAPPSYDQALSREILTRALEGNTSDYSQVQGPLRYELKIAEAILKEWHKGASLPIQALPDGISVEALEQWAKLKKELGAECMVIDKILAASKQIPKTAVPPPTPTPTAKKSSSHRFYNIYNTYFYNKAADSTVTSYAAPVFLGFIFSTVMFLALSPASPYTMPGMPTYHDRAYWTAFNSLDAIGEGFGGDGGNFNGMWTVVGRLVLGGAEVVRRVNMPS